jgi:cobalt-precorrin-6B (C15)-methyltransferase
MSLKGGPTQDEIMAIALQKLSLRGTDCIADIGCGTGKVSVAASRLAGKVYAVDRRPEAIAFARRQAEVAGVKNITFYEGEALEFLQGIDRLDAAFVGGSQHLEEVIRLLARKVSGVIVVNAVLVHTLAEAIETMKSLGILREVVHVQVSRSHAIADSLMFKPIDPVYIIVGGKRTCSSD